MVQVEGHDADVLRQLLFSYIKSRQVVARGQSLALRSAVKENSALKRKSMTEKTPRKVNAISHPVVIMINSCEHPCLPACSLQSWSEKGKCMAALEEAFEHVFYSLT